MKKVSIITVTHNSEKTIRRTMESVYGQTCPAAEYIMIDGDSTDRTVEIAEGFRTDMETKGIDFRIVSEPDEGIYDAMNKGIRMATGDIIGILNSDDWYEPDTVETVIKEFEKSGCDLLFANIRLHRKDGRSLVKKARLRRFQTSRDWNHPTMFVKAEIYKSHPFRMKGIHDDYGFYLQVRREDARIAIVDKVLANFRMGGASNHKSIREAVKRIRDRYRWCYRVNGYSRWYLVECIVIESVKMLFG